LSHAALLAPRDDGLFSSVNRDRRFAADRLFAVTLALSILVHAVVFAIHFAPPNRDRADRMSPPLEVALVNARSRSNPATPDVLAQANLDGGGNTDARRRLKSPLPVAPAPEPTREQILAMGPPAPEPPARRVTAPASPPERAQPKPPQPPPPPKPSEPPPQPQQVRAHAQLLPVPQPPPPALQPPAQPAPPPMAAATPPPVTATPPPAPPTPPAPPLAAPPPAPPAPPQTQLPPPEPAQKPASVAYQTAPVTPQPTPPTEQGLPDRLRALEQRAAELFTRLSKGPVPLPPARSADAAPASSPSPAPIAPPPPVEVAHAAATAPAKTPAPDVAKAPAPEIAKPPAPEIGKSAPPEPAKPAPIDQLARVEQPAAAEPVKLAEKPDTPPPLPSAGDILRRTTELVQLEAQIARNMEAYQQRPKRRFVGARAQEYRFARYVEDWRQKVERVGNLNYPDAARKLKLYGSLLVTVSIRADGSVETVEINRTSGHRVLDAAVVRIIELAAPFAPFPPNIRRDTDILHVTRTWTFARGDSFTGGD
jgi:protein TonB